MCKHYINWHIPICNECISIKKVGKYNCHFCHNDIETHKMDRCNVKYMKCILCNCFQTKSSKCINPDCYSKMHKYTCLKCSLYEHNINKNIYHCDLCGICRIGNKNEYKHCIKCNICWCIKSYENHPCKIDQKHNECIICLNDCWGSQMTPSILQCGHSFHQECINEYFKENYTCPICKKSAYIPLSLWNLIEIYVNNSNLSEEMDKWKTYIYCNDCENKNYVKYHPIYHKCIECNSWNTSIINIIKN
jgi:hypothetical protein